MDNVLLKSPAGMIVPVPRERYEARKQTTFKFYEVITDEEEIGRYFDLEQQPAVDVSKEDSAQADQPSPRKKKAAKAESEPPQVD